MTLQELWKIKEELSERFWGKSAEEINNIVKPNVDEMIRNIEAIKEKKSSAAV